MKNIFWLTNQNWDSKYILNVFSNHISQLLQCLRHFLLTSPQMPILNNNIPPSLMHSSHQPKPPSGPLPLLLNSGKLPTPLSNSSLQNFTISIASWACFPAMPSPNSFPPPWVHNYILAFLSQEPSISMSGSLFCHHFCTFLTNIWQNLHKICFAEECMERQQ